MSDAAPKQTYRGYLYPNDKKTSDKAPDFRGKGVYLKNDMFVSAWWEEKEGAQTLALSFTDPAALPPKGEKPAPRAASASKEEGRGRLMLNTEKRSEKAPDFKGEGLHKGEKMEVVGWWKDKDGVQMISLSFSDPSADWRSNRPSAPAAAPAPAPAPASNDLGGLDLGDIFDQ